MGQRITVWVVQQKNGVLHSIWVSEEKAKDQRNKLNFPIMHEFGKVWEVQEFLVRGID